MQFSAKHSLPRPTNYMQMITTMQSNEYQNEQFQINIKIRKRINEHKIMRNSIKNKEKGTSEHLHHNPRTRGNQPLMIRATLTILDKINIDTPIGKNDDYNPFQQYCPCSLALKSPQGSLKFIKHKNKNKQQTSFKRERLHSLFIIFCGGSPSIFPELRNIIN